MNTILTSSERINALEHLGDLMLHPEPELQELIYRAQQFNAWFTADNTLQAVNSIGRMLNKPDLELWFEDIQISPVSKKVGLVLAGNIPLVGFHDILCVLASGNKALIKLSSQDTKLIPYLLNKLTEIEPAFKDQFEFIDRLNDFDAVIATGSNNTSRYFEYYFKHVPHIIRKNRNSIAVLTGKESREDLRELGKDIFSYFGLGCRNVSKLYVPENYNFNFFFESIEEYKPIIDHHKYNNNYDYNKSIFLVNMDKHLDNGFLLLKQDSRLASPLAVLYYEEYKNLEDLPEVLTIMKDAIQCVVASGNFKEDLPIVGFGHSQEPKLWDYADGLNTIQFLQTL